MNQFKKIVSFILCLAMILTSLTFSFAETEIGPGEQKNEETELAAAVLGAEAEVNPTWFDDAKVTRATLRSKVSGLLSRTTYYIFDKDGKQVGNKLSSDSSSVTLTEGGVYSVTTDEQGTDVKATFTFHLNRSYEIQPESPLEFSYYDGMGLDASTLKEYEEKLFDAIVAVITPNSITAGAVTIEYNARTATSKDWQSLSYTPKSDRHKFGANPTESIRITIPASDTDHYKQFQDTYTVTIVDPRRDVEIFSAQNGADNAYQNGKLTSLAAIKAAIGLSVSPASFYDSVQIIYNNDPLENGEELPFGDYASGQGSKDVNITVKFPGNDEYKPTSASVSLTLVDPRMDVETLSAHDGADNKYYNGKLTNLAAVKTAIGLSVSPASLYGSVQIIYNKKALVEGETLPFGDYSKNQTTKDVDITASFPGNDEYKPTSVGVKLNLSDTRLPSDRYVSENAISFPYYENMELNELKTAIWEQVLEVGMVTTPASLGIEDLTFQYNAGAAYHDLDYEPDGLALLANHKFGSSGRTQETVRVDFPGNDEYKGFEENVTFTVTLTPAEKSEIALNDNQTFNFYEGKVIDDDVFASLVALLVKATTLSGIGSIEINPNEYKIEYYYEGVLTIGRGWYDIKSKSLLAPDFGQNKDSETIRVSFKGKTLGGKVYAKSSAEVTLKLEDQRKDTKLIFRSESPSFQYSEDQGVSKAAFWNDVVSESSLGCSDFEITYATGRNSSLLDDGYESITYTPRLEGEHKFGTASSEAVKFIFDGNDEYKSGEWGVTVYPNDNRAEYQITERNPLQFNYYNDVAVQRVISSGNLALINDELFKDIVASISPSGITSGGVSIKYYKKNDGFISELLAGDAWDDVSAEVESLGRVLYHKFGEKSVEKVRIEIEGTEALKPYSHVFDVNMVDLRTPSAIAVKQNPYIVYFSEQDDPVSKQAIFNAIVIPSDSTPKGISADDITIKYASGSGFEEITSAEALYGPFADDGAVDIQLSFAGNHQYKSYTTVVSLALKDPRIATSIRLKYNIVPQLIPGLDGQIPDFVLSYNASPEEFKRDIIDQIAVMESDRLLRNVSFTADDIVVSPGNLSTQLLGLQDVEVSYKGNKTYRNAKESFKVYVLPAAATIKVNDQDVVYGTSLGAINLVTTNPADLDYLCVIAGMDTEIQSFLSIYFPESLKAKLRLSFDTGIFTGMVQLLENLAKSFGISSEFFKVTDGAIILDFYDMLVSMVGDGKNLSEFIGIISDVAARMPEQITETLPFDMSVVENLVGILGNFSELLTITIDKTPEDAGLYLVTALSTDKNYLAMDTGHITILPKYSDVSLEWNQEMSKSGLFANNQMSISQAAVFSWGGYLTAGGVKLTDHINTAYIGVDYKGRSVISQTAPTGAGVYDETVSWIGGNYAALPITRTYTINRYPTDITATAASFVYDGQPHTLEFAAVSNGDDLVSYITPLYVGAGYVSTGAPIDAGEYLVTFDFAGDDLHANKTVNVKLTITEAAPAVSLEPITTTYTGIAVTSGSVSVSLVSGEAFSGDVSYEYYLTSDCSVTTDAIVNAGTYYMKAFTKAFKNYTAAESEAAEVIILKAQPVLETPQAVTVVYNGKIQKISPVSILLSDGTTASGDAIGYTYYQMVCGSLLAMNGWPLYVGEYFVELAYNGNENYLYAISPLGDFMITKAALNITIDNKTVYVGEALPEYTFTCTGLADIDEIVLSCAAVETQTQTQYAIFVENAEELSANYNITVNDAFLTVAERPQVYVSSTKKYEASVSGDENTVKAEAKVSRGEAELLPIADKTIRKVIGDDVRTGVVKIDLSGIKADINAVKIPAATVNMIAAAIADKDNDACGLEIIMKNGSVSFDAAAAESIADQMSGKDLVLKLDVNPGSLSSAQKQTVKNINAAEIIDVYLESNGKKITTFGNGSAEVKLPYAFKDGQEVSHLAVLYLAADGSTEDAEALYEDGNIILTPERFSHYVISFSEECRRNRYCPMHSFSDLDMNEWYHDGIHFCLANGLMHGEPNAIFAPLGTLTRSMVVTMLWNMEGKPQRASQISFCDVPEDAWYLDAVRWAEEFGVTHGCDGGEFQPDRAVTKEELACFISNYAALKGKGFIGDWTFNLGYLDAAEISDWAREAVMWCDANGVIHGYNNKFNPKGEASRAEAATMFMYFCQVLAK